MPKNNFDIIYGVSKSPRLFQPGLTPNNDSGVEAWTKNRRIFSTRKMWTERHSLKLITVNMNLQYFSSNIQYFSSNLQYFSSNLQYYQVTFSAFQRNLLYRKINLLCFRN